MRRVCRVGLRWVQAKRHQILSSVPFVIFVDGLDAVFMLRNGLLYPDYKFSFNHL